MFTSNLHHSAITFAAAVFSTLFLVASTSFTAVI